ncbi:hypothetical protein SD70_24845 [Gordoniibacillus kamchatkensis]|uniref:Uncharacterized protein n=1 Tax=Gordoniibacillus kamchatkensis TaxID=1590651 RepID=A0ABR5ADL3_9BACL|nr:hypothetical protein [Paenibacillus sp. VKM B-2647]KIL38680.1 hypothetical protein SD70_24845 [Paenibacillus sp. VKM B-2647]
MKKIVITTIAIAVLVLMTCFFSKSEVSVPSHAAGIGDIGNSLVTKHYDDGNGHQVRDPAKGDLPTYITFKPETKQYQFGYGDRKIWEQNFQNKFLWYSITEPDPVLRNNANMDLTQMYENNVYRNNTNYYQLVKPGIKGLWQNVKWGAVEPGKQSIESFNRVLAQSGGVLGTSGTTKFTNQGVAPDLYGKMLEFRYAGVSESGYPIPNPYFPADYPTKFDSDWRPANLAWIDEPWNHGKTIKTEYDADYDPNDPIEWAKFERKVQLFIKYLFPSNPELRRPDMDLWDDAADWARKFTLHNDPSVSTGVVTGFQTNGYYASFVLKSPPQPNLRLTLFKVTEKDTGKVVGLMTRNADDNSDTTTYWQINNQEVERGKTYVVTATVKNMVVDGLGNHPTNYTTPIRMRSMVANDDDSHIDGKWTTEPNENVIPGINVDPATRIYSISYGGSVTFDKTKDDNDSNNTNVQTWEFTVPNSPAELKNEFVYAAALSQGFYLKGDDSYTDDNIGRLRFHVKPEDIGVVPEKIQLIDPSGNVTNDVVPGVPYTIRFTVRKYKGNTPVGEPGNYYNPFAALYVNVTDNAAVYKRYDKVEATETLYKEGDEVVIELKDAIVPSVPTIHVDYGIYWFNRSPQYANQSSDPTNDDASKTWRSVNNFSVSNFTIKPSSVISPNSTSYETLTFDFIANNKNPESQPKNVLIQIKDKYGSIVKSQVVNLPANEEYPISWTVSNVPIQNSSNGTENQFMLEINPAPRQYVETSTDGTDPYLDNVAYNSVMGHQASAQSHACLTVHTQNNWTTTHYIHEWYGYLQTVSWCGELGCYSYSYCVTTYSYYYTQTVNYYESYQITKVLFRSKLTKDKYGGDGWIDITNQPGQVKAGYGFEIKFITQYQTNTYSASPKPWYSGCSGKSVSPVYGSYVSAPNILYVTMPFKDNYGDNVTYTLYGSNSGSWDNLTQTYEMPYHNAFNLENTREVFVNETARDGDYQIKVNTYPYFYGSYDKPRTPYFLCDSKQVTIRVQGSYHDDVKSHLVQ